MDENYSLKIKRDSISAFLGNSSVLFIIFGFYFYLIAEVFIDFENFRILLLLLGYVTFGIALFFDTKLKLNNQLFLYLICSLLIYLVSNSFWLVRFDINIYLSTLTAIVIINRYDFFLKAMRVFILLTLILALYEFFTKQYLFVVSRETFFGYRPLDEAFFGGYSGIFRSKVYFEGPLALSQFAIGMALIFRNNVKLLYCILVIAIIANGRLGIVICGAVLVLYYFNKHNIISFLLRPKILLIFILSLCASVIIALNLMDQTSIDRLVEVFNTSNEGNSERINFWIKGFKMFVNYDFLHLIFGNNGAFESLHKNNSENGWLTLLLNNGILGFLYYFIPVILITVNSLKNKPFNFIYIFLFILCMFVQTFHLGASANLIYWLIIYSFLKGHKND